MEQSPQLVEPKKKKRPRHITLEIQGLAWNRHTNVAGLTY